MNPNGTQKTLLGVLLSVMAIGLTAFIWVSSSASSKASRAIETTTKLEAHQENIMDKLTEISLEQREARRDRKKLIEDMGKVKGKLGLNGG